MGPAGVVVHPAGTFVYVANGDDGSFSVIDTSTNTVVDTVTVGKNSTRLDLNRSGTRLYIVSGSDVPPVSAQLFVFDTTDNSHVATVELEVEPSDVAVHPLEHLVYASAADKIFVIDASDNSVTTTITLDPSPSSLEVNPAGTFLYATAGEGVLQGVVHVIDTATNTVVETINVGGAPNSVGRFIGPAPAVHLSATSIDFGEQEVNTTSAEQDVTLTNIGSLALDIDSIDVSTGDFLIDDDCPLSLLVDEFCTIAASFDPFIEGPQSATVTIVTNTNESPHTISLTGTTPGGGCSLIR
jgi:YVTN family beta-propeller protein